MSRDSKNCLQPNAIAIENNKIYFVDRLSSQIIIVRIADKKIDCCINLPEKATFDDESKPLLYIHKGNIIFIKNTDSSIYVWDDSTALWDKYDLFKKRREGFYLFSHARVIDDYFYIFPFTEGHLLIFDLNQKKVVLSSNIFTILRKHFAYDFMSINEPSWIDNEHISGCISANNAIFIMNLMKQDIQYHYFKEEGCVISTVATAGNSLILCDKGRHLLLRVNKKNFEIEKEYEYGEKRARVISINHVTIVMEIIDSDEFCIFDDKLDLIYKNEESLVNNDKTIDTSGITIYGDNVGYYYNRISKRLYSIDTGGNVKENNILRELELPSVCKEKMDIGGNIFKENVLFGIEGFTNIVSSIN